MKLIVIPAAMLLLGLSLAGIYSDAPRMVRTDWQAAVPYGNSARYFEEFDRNVSPQARRFDVGVGLASFGASLVALIAVARIWTVERFKRLSTPRRRWPWIIAANAVWIYYVWATLQALELEFHRNVYPPWADSMVIASAGVALFGAFGGVLMNAGLLLCFFGAKLPVSLWIKPRTVRSKLLNAGIGIALLACLWAGSDAVLLGDPFTPPAVVGVIALLCIGRAAACAT